MKKALLVGALVFSVVALIAAMPSSTLAWGGHGYGGYGWGYYGYPTYYGYGYGCNTGCGYGHGRRGWGGFGGMRLPFFGSMGGYGGRGHYGWY